MLPPPPTSTLFPYTTLFRSGDDLLRDPPEVLDEQDPQADRDGPELANRERLDLLIRADHSPERMRRSSRSRLASSDRKSTRLNSSHMSISYAVFCLKKKKQA